MSPTLNGTSAIRRFKHSNVIEICDGITFDFYTRLPHICVIGLSSFILHLGCQAANFCAYFGDVNDSALSTMGT